MAIFRHFVPRSVRRVAHPVGHAKRRMTPKAVRQVMYVRHPVGTVTSAATLSVIRSRGTSKRSSDVAKQPVPGRRGWSWLPGRAKAARTWHATITRTADGQRQWQCDHHHPTLEGAQRCAEEYKASRS
jgi:hypothetical protein